MSEQGATTSPCDVLVISARVGAGHAQAAQAVVEAIRERRPDAQVRLEDVMDHVSPFFRIYYQGGYVAGMTRVPRLYGWAFDLGNRSDSPRRTFWERVRLAEERFWLKGLGQKVIEWRPRVVLCTHFVIGPVLAGLAAAGRLKAKLCVVVTDHFPHRWWFAPGIDHWFVPDGRARDRFVRWGVSPEQITVCDIPIRLKWTAPLDRSKVLADWRLPTDKKIILLSGGAEFTCGPVEATASGILAACPNAHVVVLAGRNKELLARLSRLCEAAPAAGRLTPVSFTDRAHELVGVASLMVTKPGGVTTSECCAMGTPMVLLPPVRGQESCNAEYLCAHGAAVAPGGMLKVIEAVRRLLAAPSELAAMAGRARGLHRPAARPIAAKVIEWVSLPGRT